MPHSSGRSVWQQKVVISIVYIPFNSLYSGKNVSLGHLHSLSISSQASTQSPEIPATDVHSHSQSSPQPPPHTRATSWFSSIFSLLSSWELTETRPPTREHDGAGPRLPTHLQQMCCLLLCVSQITREMRLYRSLFLSRQEFLPTTQMSNPAKNRSYMVLWYPWGIPFLRKRGGGNGAKNLQGCDSEGRWRGERGCDQDVK